MRWLLCVGGVPFFIGGSCIATLLLRADQLGAFALGGLERQDRPATVRAGPSDRFVPDRVTAIGVTTAGEEDLAVT